VYSPSLTEALIRSEMFPIFNNVTIFCWHIHVYFLERNAQSVNHALALRRDFIDNFFPPSVPQRSCAAEVTTNATCLWGCYDNSVECLNMHPTGPHTFGSWGASMPTSMYASVLPRVFANKERYASTIAGILIHPLTAARGEDTVETRVRDHTWGIWGATALPLDYDFLRHNVYDCSVCDPVLCRQACPPSPPPNPLDEL
jgi:aromatic ring-cleaving dioxygenase